MYQFMSWGSPHKYKSREKKHFRILNALSAKELRKHTDGHTIHSVYTGWKLHFPKGNYHPVEYSVNLVSDSLYSAKLNTDEEIAIYEYTNEFNLTNNQILKGILNVIGLTNFKQYNFVDERIGNYQVYKITTLYTHDHHNYEAHVHLVKKDKRVIILTSFNNLQGQETFLNSLWNNLEWTDNHQLSPPDEALKLKIADINNYFAIAQYNESDLLMAEKLFGYAYQLDSNNLTYLANQIRTLNHLNHYTKALNLCEKHKEQLKSDPASMSLYAESYINVGKTEEGCALYEQLFKEGYNDEYHLSILLNQLLPKQAERALAILSIHLEKFPSLKYKLWKSRQCCSCIHN